LSISIGSTGVILPSHVKRYNYREGNAKGDNVTYDGDVLVDYFSGKTLSANWALPMTTIYS
jgi:hypothetical protein